MVIDFTMCLITTGVSIDFALGSYEVPEENATMAVCALLTGLTEIPVMVKLATASGTAIQGTYTTVADLEGDPREPRIPPFGWTKY